MDSAMTQMGIRVSAELRKCLEQMAARERRTLSDYVRIVLEDFVKQQVSKAVRTAR